MFLRVCVFLAACAPCCPCSGSQRSLPWPSCTWPAASASLTSKSGLPSSPRAAGGNSSSRTSPWSSWKVPIAGETLARQRFAPPAFLRHQEPLLRCRHLPPDPGSVFPGEQAYSPAAAGEGARPGASSPGASSPAGTASSRQPSSTTATQEDLSSGGQPCTPAQTLAREYMCGGVLSSKCVTFTFLLHLSVFPQISSLLPF